MAKKKIRMRASLDQNIVSVKCLLVHPMETGRRKDDKDTLIPAHYIQKVIAENEATRVFEAYWGTGVSKNPFISFKFTGGAKGDTVTLTWVDNLGNSEKAETTVK